MVDRRASAARLRLAKLVWLDQRGPLAGEDGERISFVERADIAEVATRQPELCSFVYRVLAEPPYPLTRAQECVLAQTLWALIYGLDEVVNGRSIPRPRRAG